ncbi:MAG: IS630 family transposase [bacterium]|nr:IS630 family transposase [bacterium]
MKKKDGRKIPRDAMEYMRIQSVRLFESGKKADEIAEFFGVTVDAVYKWKRKYKQKGIAGLKSKKAPGAVPKLSKKEQNKLLVLLKQPANTYGFQSPLWDCKRIKQLVKEKFHQDIHYSNIWRLLKRLNLSNQVPEKEALERSKHKVRYWLKEKWPKIKEHRRRWQAMLYFLDETGISLIPVLGKTWAPKGKTPKVKVTGNRGGIVVTAAISPAGRLLFRIEKETIRAEQHIEFLQQVMKNHPRRKIIVIEDNAKPHIAAKVDNFVEANKNKLAIYYLPTYSPDLNPQEDIWKYLKHVKMKAHQVRKVKELRSLVHNKLKGIRQTEGLVSAIFCASGLY